MSLETAHLVAQFLEANEAQQFTLMGGEVFCHPQWQELLPILLSVESASYVRIVSNSDWVEGGDSAFLTALEPYKGKVKLSLSKDRWHNNKNVEAASEELERRGFKYDVTQSNEDDPDGIVPVGRGEFHSSLYSFMACYCHNPVKKYGFLIDEEGLIYKCGFGAWDYSSIHEHLEGGFAARFQEFNRKFYGVFIGSCASCQRAWSHAKHEER
jgi:hypothetical protein